MLIINCGIIGEVLLTIFTPPDFASSICQQRYELNGDVVCQPDGKGLFLLSHIRKFSHIRIFDILYSHFS